MKTLEKHEKYMLRCIYLARNNESKYYPNPSVGSIIVKDNIIIAEGTTSNYGENHAEVNAINNVKNKNDLKGATLYVTLEPCSHYGKTPPCAELIFKNQISSVIIGTKDISSKVNGDGILFLKNKGIKVTVGVLENKCNDLHRNFLHFNKYKRPYIILKWAETMDNFIAPLNKSENKPFWISCVESRQLVHKWRSEEHAILIGHNTVIKDNPSLTVRHINGNNPLRIILDDKKTLDKNFNVFNNESMTIVISNFSSKNNIGKYLCDTLYKNKVQSIIIEGGKKTLEIFIKNNIWDEARIFKNELKLNNGVLSPRISGVNKSKYKIGKDELRIIYPN
jgi:diaminohydroxyphosphoribosylaminopyrimidine deaminase/5-amino-6-(5-phosphoribosylamino)uracil reductase